MEPVDYLRFVAALLFVLALIGLIGWAVRRGGLAGGLVRGLSLGRAGADARRLDVIEARAIDARRRLVLVRRDGVEHLLLLAPSGDTVVETGIVPPENGS